MDREVFRLLVVAYASAVRNRLSEEGKYERLVRDEFSSVLGTVEGMIGELKPVFRPGFVGDNPVWACGKLRDDYEALQSENELLRAEIGRLREALKRINKDSIDCVAREIACEMLAHGR